MVNKQLVIRSLDPEVRGRPAPSSILAPLLSDLM